MSETQKAPNVLVIELVNQQESNFVMDGTPGEAEEMDLKTFLSAPNARKISNKSSIQYTVQDGAEKGMTKLRRIRYIKGCDIIDVIEQDKAGYKPAPQLDVIWILNGKLTVIESGADIGLYRFLKAHEGNVSNPDRPDGAFDIFKEINTAVEAVQVESAMDEEFKILRYLNGLKTLVGENTFNYNEDALQFLCTHFKLGSFDEYKSEAWVSVATYAREYPKKFLTGIAGMTAVVETEVTEALSKGVISIDEVKAFFTQNSKVIMQMPANLTNEEKKQKLVDFFINPGNRNEYDALRGALHKAKMALTTVIE